MLLYFLGITIILPVVLASAFLIKKNSLLRRAAVFFMAVALTAGAVRAAVHGADRYEIPAGHAKVMGAILVFVDCTLRFQV